MVNYAVNYYMLNYYKVKEQHNPKVKKIIVSGQLQNLEII